MLTITSYSCHLPIWHSGGGMHHYLQDLAVDVKVPSNIHPGQDWADLSNTTDNTMVVPTLWKRCSYKFWQHLALVPTEVECTFFASLFGLKYPVLNELIVTVKRLTVTVIDSLYWVSSSYIKFNICTRFTVNQSIPLWKEIDKLTGLKSFILVKNNSQRHKTTSPPQLFTNLVHHLVFIDPCQTEWKYTVCFMVQS